MDKDKCTVVSEKFIRYDTDRSGTYSQLTRVHIKCDTAADMPEPLPYWTAGSRCDVLENGGSIYELNHSGKWMPITNNSASADFEAISTDELDAMWEAD